MYWNLKVILVLDYFLCLGSYFYIRAELLIQNPALILIKYR